MDIKGKIKKLPFVPGVYIMKSQDGEVLYIGKASSLRKRVGSHFSSVGHLKSGFLKEKVSDIEYIECDTPEQALILEAAFIKEKKPKYNVALRDSKAYPYIEITKERFPRVFLSRGRRKEGNILFGPYPAANTLKSALMLIRKIFPYRSCINMPKSVCLFFHLNLCPAPCTGRISAAEYKGIIENICKILKGERKKLVDKLKEKMNKLAVSKEFEKAAEIRDTLIAIDNLYKGRPLPHEIVSLKEALQLPRLPLVIEAIDISSLSRYNAAGSVVVFRDGVPDKASYRRFSIKEADTKDDYAMIAEVVRRRYSRIIREKKALPDLVIIDGGKGHLQRAKQELDVLNAEVPCLGIAKKNEEIWIHSRNAPLIIPKSSPCLQLIQRIRDEAHRFARKYHLLKREKQMLARASSHITKKT